jgi:hypothetical protein
MDKDKLAKYIVQYLLEDCGSEIWLGDKGYDDTIQKVTEAINDIENKRMLCIYDENYKDEFMCNIDEAQIILTYNKDYYKIAYNNTHSYAEYTTKERCEEVLKEMKEFYEKYNGKQTYILPKE